MIANFRINEIAGKKGEGTGTGKIETAFKVTGTQRKNDVTVGDYILINFDFDVKYPGEMGDINFKGNLAAAIKQEIEKFFAIPRSKFLI